MPKNISPCSLESFFTDLQQMDVHPSHCLLAYFWSVFLHPNSYPQVPHTGSLLSWVSLPCTSAGCIGPLTMNAFTLGVCLSCTPVCVHVPPNVPACSLCSAFQAPQHVSACPALCLFVQLDQSSLHARRLPQAPYTTCLFSVALSSLHLSWFPFSLMLLAYSPGLVFAVTQQCL